MKNYLLIFIVLISINVFPQKNKLSCNENIEYETVNDGLILYVNNIVIKLSNQIELDIYKKCAISISCFNTDINLTYSFQNGNEYKIVNNLFKKREFNYYLDNSYIEYSDRNESSLTVIPGNDVKIENFEIKKDFLDLNKTEKNISLITGHQNETEVDELPYYKLIKENYIKKRYNNIILFTNPFVINNLGIFDSERVDKLNNIAFYSMKSKGYLEAIYILIKVIEKSPNRDVAYLNLADCYWEINDKNKAILNYKKYIKLMKDQKKDLKKIPKYVYQRVK